MITLQGVDMVLSAFDFPTVSGVEPVTTRCSLTGEPITSGVALKHVIREATADIADTFRYSSHLSESAARIFADSAFTGNIYVDESGQGVRPFVALSSATQDRPAWSDWVRTLQPGKRNIAIATLNTKRRLWYHADVSQIGEQWRVYFLDAGIERSLLVNWYLLIEQLGCIENIIETTPFTKTMLGNPLLDSVNYKTIHQVGLAVAKEVDGILGAWRETDTFTFALFIAQNHKKESSK